MIKRSKSFGGIRFGLFVANRTSRGCSVGAVHRSPQRNQAHSGALLAPWPPNGMGLTSPARRAEAVVISTELERMGSE